MLEECFERRQLRRIPPDAGKAKRSLETARLKLADAEALSQAGFPAMALVNAYASMFHACRALLFKDGVQEKSHFCLIAYVKEKYVKTGLLPAGIITLMDAFREQRHDVFYGFGEHEVKAADEKLALENAALLIRLVSKLS